MIALGLGVAGCGPELDDPLDEVGQTSEALRRSDFGQSRSISVADPAGRWHNVPLPAWSLPTTVTTTRDPLRSRAISNFSRISWVGDANSYIDLFNGPLELRFGTTTIDGSSSGQFMRLMYPHASNAQISFSFRGRRTTFPRALTRTLPTDQRWRALRHYDRGECSGEVSWTRILTSIVGGLTPRLDDTLRANSLGGATLAGSASGTATIRAGRWGTPTNADDFTVRASYNVGACNGLMRLSFTGRFGVSGGAPSYRVLRVSASLDFRDDFCAGWLALAAGHGFNAGALQTRISSTVEDTLRTDLGPAIREGMIAATAQRPLPRTPLPCRVGTRGDASCLTIIRSGLPTAAASALRATNARCIQRDGSRPECLFVPTLRRLNTRADGIEAVLAERRSDPFYSVFAAARACDRPEGSTAAPVRRSYGAVFAR